MAAEEITIELDNGETEDVLFATAEGARPGSAVIVIHDLLGFDEDSYRIANRLADAGYTAIVPKLFDQKNRKLSCVVKTLSSYVLKQGYVYDRLEAVRRWLLMHPTLAVSKIGVMGFCMGGGFALTYAQKAPVSVVAPFYGEVPKHKEALKGICPVVGGWGEQDKTFAPHGHRLVEHLDALGVEHDIAFYPDAGHSYMNQHDGVIAGLGRYTPIRACYNEAASEDSWRRVFQFFERYL